MQLSNTWKATVGLMIGAILCLPAQAAAEKKIIMRYSHSSAAMVEEPHHTAALDFKKYVEEKTKGRVEVQIYPASQLGGEERAFQDVQQGVIQIASLASNNAAVFAPSLYVIDLPYLFRTNQEGWAILDKYWDELNAKTIKESGNRIIYAHNMLDGSMFRTLLKYQQKDFWQRNPVISFNTLYEEQEYEVVAAFYDKVYKKSDTNFKFYQFYDTSDQSSFDEAMAYYREHALYDTGVTAQCGDLFLTLVTCAYQTENGRFVVVARKK